MKTYIIISNEIIINNLDDIKPTNIQGLYLNIKIAFNKYKLLYNNNLLYEIDLETNKISNKYKLYNQNYIIDINNNIKFNIK